MGNKNRKLKKETKKGSIVWFEKREWTIPIIYIIIPIIVIWGFQCIFEPGIFDILRECRVGNISVVNSTYAQNNVYKPFAENCSLILGVLVSIKITERISKKINNGKKMGIKQARKVLRIIEVITVLLSITVTMYNKSEFDYSQYGNNVNEERSIIENSSNEVQDLPSEHNATIHSIGIKKVTYQSEESDGIYNILNFIAQKIYLIKDNIPIIIALGGAIVIPLNRYLQMIEKA